MTKKMFAQLCATAAIAAATLLVGRNMHDLSMIIVFAVGVLATILSVFRVRSLRVKELAERRARRERIAGKAADASRSRDA